MLITNKLINYIIFVGFKQKKNKCRKEGILKSFNSNIKMIQKHYRMCKSLFVEAALLESLTSLMGNYDLDDEVIKVITMEEEETKEIWVRRGGSGLLMMMESSDGRPNGKGLIMQVMAMVKKSSSKEVWRNKDEIIHVIHPLIPLDSKLAMQFMTIHVKHHALDTKIFAVCAKQ